MSCTLCSCQMSDTMHSFQMPNISVFVVPRPWYTLEDPTVF